MLSLRRQAHLEARSEVLVRPSVLEVPSGSSTAFEALSSPRHALARRDQMADHQVSDVELGELEKEANSDSFEFETPRTNEARIMSVCRTSKREYVLEQTYHSAWTGFVLALARTRRYSNAC